MFNKNVFKIIGLIWIFLGFSMILSSLWSIYYSEPDLFPLLISSGIAISLGAFLYGISNEQKNKELTARDGFVIVSVGWVTMAVFSALPLYISNFYFDNYFITYLDCYFESMSGLTTTGATILGINTVAIEELSHGLLFWRSFTQFIGGMGIILFTIAMLPILGMGGVQLFRAEVAGPVADKLTPRIKETAKYLWAVYIALIIIETIVLYIEGIIFNIDKLTFFNAICHSMTTIATGGFSTFNNSILGFESAIVSCTIIIFMLLGAMNFTLHFLFIFKKTFQYSNDSEFKFYIFSILFIFALTFINILGIHEDTFTDITASLFNTITFMSTTGYTLYDYGTWPPLSQLLVIFMFLGAMNFTLHFLLVFKKSFQYFNDSEFKFYIFSILFISVLIFVNISGIYEDRFTDITASLFNTITFISTTGYTLYNYETWPPLSQLLVFFMSFIGGMAGSTTGGIKLIRTILVVKYIKTEISRMIHPRGLYNVKIGNKVIDDDIIRSTLGFYLFYILIFVACALLISMNGLDMISSLSISASSIGNIGPGLGEIGPTSDWSSLNAFTKLLTTFCMLLGRLEIFSIIVVFSKSFWVK